MRKLRMFYEILMERTIRRVVREIKYRKRLRKMKKENPFIY